MNEILRRGFQLGDKYISPHEGRITGPGGTDHVQPKVMDVLICLAARPGEIVERDEIFKEVWGDTSVSDDVLTRCISELRHHLDDHHESIQYILTVPKRGYRLVAKVKLTDDNNSGAFPSLLTDSAEHPSVIQGIWKDLERRNVVRVGIAYLVVAWLLLQVGDTIFEALQLPGWALTLLLALLALGFPITVVLAWVFELTPAGVVLDVRDAPAGTKYLRRNLDVVIIGALVIAVGVLAFRSFGPDIWIDDGTQRDSFQVPPPDNSIAVLRFLNIGGEPHFADGLGEELLDRLAKLKELGVAARTSSWAFAEKNVDIPTIAEELEVNYVLEGSVRQLGDRIRVTAQLNDGKSGKHVWSQTYDRQLTTANFFETQSAIARQVVGLLKISLSLESEQRLAASPQTSIEALELYLRGQEAFRQPHSEETLDAAAAYFQRAIDVDPRFAMSFAGLCQAELGRYILSRNIVDFEDSERACHRALTLDGDMPRVSAALGTLYLFSGQDEKAEEELRKALEANPNLIDAYADLAEAIEFQGRLDEAEDVFQSMVLRQPGYWYAHNALGSFLYRQSRYQEAASSWTTVVQLESDNQKGYNNIAAAYYMLGDFDAASRAYEKSVEIAPYVDNYSNLGLSYFYEGRYEEAAEMQLQALQLSPDDPRVNGRLATAYQYAGREDEAMPIYQVAIDLLTERLAINPNEIRYIRYLAVYTSSVGQVSEARTAIDQALELQPKSSGTRFDAAKVALAEGDSDRALGDLELAKELGYSTHIIRSDPFFTEIHDDPRFRLLVQ